jgi:phage-related protein
VFSTAFGDGYTQRAGNGINVDLRKWDDMPFTKRSQSEIFAIEAFLKAQGATTPFNWQVPGQDLALVVCPRWSTPKADDFGSWSITATFEETPA